MVGTTNTNTNSQIALRRTLGEVGGAGQVVRLYAKRFTLDEGSFSEAYPTGDQHTIPGATTVQCIRWRPNGRSLFVLQGSVLSRYDLPSGAVDFDITSLPTASAASTTIAGALRFQFKPDGMAIAYSTAAGLGIYPLGTAWDIGTISSTASSTTTGLTGGVFAIRPDGAYLFGKDRDIYQMATAWDLSTATDTGYDRRIIGDANFNAEGDKLYFVRVFSSSAIIFRSIIPTTIEAAPTTTTILLSSVESLIFTAGDDSQFFTRRLVSGQSVISTFAIPNVGNVEPLLSPFKATDANGFTIDDSRHGFRVGIEARSGSNVALKNLETTRHLVRLYDNPAGDNETIAATFALGVDSTTPDIRELVFGELTLPFSGADEIIYTQNLDQTGGLSNADFAVWNSKAFVVAIVGAEQLHISGMGSGITSTNIQSVAAGSGFEAHTQRQTEYESSFVEDFPHLFKTHIYAGQPEYLIDPSAIDDLDKWKRDPADLLTGSETLATADIVSVDLTFGTELGDYTRNGDLFLIAMGVFTDYDPSSGGGGTPPSGIFGAELDEFFG